MEVEEVGSIGELRGMVMYDIGRCGYIRDRRAYIAWHL